MTDDVDATPEVPAELFEALYASPSRLVLLVGAGISRRVRRPDGRTFPSWIELIRDAFKWASDQGFRFTPEQESAFNQLLSRSDSKSLVHAAGWLKLAIGEGLLEEFLAEALRFVPAIPSPIHKLLTKIPARGIITFNYDRLLESALNTPAWSIATQEEEAKLSMIQGGQTGFFIFKAHGDISQPRSLVFGHEDYRRVILQNKAYRKVLSTLFEQHVVLMLGFGADDPDVEYVFDEILTTFSAPPLRVYALMPKGQVNALYREIWMRERRLRLIEYAASGGDHGAVDRFILKLIEGGHRPAFDNPPPNVVADADAANLPTFVLSTRRRLVKAWDKISRLSNNSSDAYPRARERAQVVDETLKEILEESSRSVDFPGEGLAVIARGGYGMGHLSSSSDIDITLLHSPARKEEAEAMGLHFFGYLRDCMGPVGLKALPIINTIDECRQHWSSDPSSLMSFTFSRLIVGDLNLHIKLREEWRRFVRTESLAPVVQEIQKKRLSREIEDELPDFLNIKTCGGGLLEVMTIHFVDEVLRLRGKGELDHSESELERCVGRMLALRELAFSLTKTLVYSRERARSALVGRQLDENAWRALTKCRHSVRKRLVESLLRLAA